MASKRRINGKLFGDVLKSLVANALIAESPETTPSGQISKIVAYIPGNREHLSPKPASEKGVGVPANNHAEAQ